MQHKGFLPGSIAILVRRSLSSQPLSVSGKEKVLGVKSLASGGSRRKHVIHIPRLPSQISPIRPHPSPLLIRDKVIPSILLQPPQPVKRPLLRRRRSSLWEKLNLERDSLRKRKFDYKQNALRRYEEMERAMSSEDLRLWGLGAKIGG